MTDKKICAVLLAAGNGSRMKSDVKKQFIEINELPLFCYSAKVLSQIDEIDRIILVTSTSDIAYVREVIKRHNIQKIYDVVPGGGRRQDSVKNAVDTIPEYYEHVLIHDSARPFVKKEDILNVIRNGVEFNCSVLGVKVKDTIKSIDEKGFVTSTPDRDFLVSVQTPQVVKLDIIKKGLEQFHDKTFTDDAGVMEVMGVKTKITFGSYSNIKITTPDDLKYLKDLI